MKNRYMRSVKERLKNVKPEIWLIFILAFALSLRLHFFMGLDWSDDVSYVDVASRILKGTYHPSHPPKINDCISNCIFLQNIWY